MYKKYLHTFGQSYKTDTTSLKKRVLMIHVTANNETYLGLYVKYPIFLPNFNKFLLFKHFHKYPIKHFTVICLSSGRRVATYEDKDR